LLQLKLRACGYDPGVIDGDYGKRTEAAVLAFQVDRPDIDDDGIAGPQTLGAIDMAVAKVKSDADAARPPNDYVPCNGKTWLAFQALVDSIVGKPVRYGPGRGLCVNNAFVITYGAGRLGGTTTQWPNVLNKTYPAFHCSSWTNFFMSWLCRRNEDFTHAGNIPSLFTLLEATPELHQNPGAGPYRGFGDVCFRVPIDGSGAKRLGISGVVDMKELLDRKDSLPTFIVCGQSTKLSTGWKWWHHTVLFAVSPKDGKLYRIAADGTKGPNGYSATPMRWIEITPANVGNFANVAYKPYGVRTSDGSYGDQSRPIAPVVFEP
jgi:peptidoglycan hydrolase-like protein with peptidoglycan-binding domain